MFRFTAQIFGVTVLAIGLIWFASPGDAVQSSSDIPTTLWAETYAADPYADGSDEGDTVHINVTEENPAEVAKKKKDNFYRSVKSLTQTAYHIRNQYMEDVDMEEIIKAGIVGMLSDLDRFSVLMEQRSYDALMESTHGKYEGLGLQIDSRDDYITIITPIEGTPAHRKGLRAGDVIWEIEGQSTYQMKTSDASKLMRGEAGTSIRLKIKRAGIPDLLEYQVDRALIMLKSVNYYGTVPGTDIGYVRLTRFAEETSTELREALASLNEQNVSALIFDLRSNGGGLLDQAKEVAELFLEEGREIVYTKGRFSSSERHYVSERPPVLDLDKRLVVLVDEGTASASEIVAGAIQDWDRGLIIGNTTYGKGLVQGLFPVSSDRTFTLKLTTAKYYVPSGRCIQKPETQAKRSAHDDDLALGADSMNVLDDRDVYYTNGGRVVYGGGGIVPDILVDRETWEPIEINLERQSMFFDYAVKYIADHPDVKPDTEISDEMLADFRAFIEEREFDYKTSMQVALEELEATVQEEDQEDSFGASIEELKSLVKLEKTKDFDKSTDYIKRSLKREIALAVAGERGIYENIVLVSDPAVRKALEVIAAPSEYARLITEGHTAAEGL